MVDNLGNIIGSGDVMGSIEDGIGDIVGGGNVMLDPATDMRKTIADIFVAIIEIFSFLSGMFKI